MRALPSFIAAGLVLGSVLPAAGATTATGRETCHLVRDASDDVADWPGADRATYDVLGGDVATTRQRLVVAIRLAALQDDGFIGPSGHEYEFDFTVHGVNFYAVAALMTGASAFTAYTSENRLDPEGNSARTGQRIGTMSGVIDRKHNLIRMSAPLKVFTKYASFSQTTITHLAAASWAKVGTTAAGEVFNTGGMLDVATSSRSYVPFRPSCIT